MKKIQLTRGYVALVDDADYEMASAFKWHTHASGVKIYAARTEYLGMVNGKKKQKMILLHRFIVASAPGKEIDHRDGNGLNCQRFNLRHCTRSQNICNGRNRQSRSGLRGAYYQKTARRWESRIYINKRAVSLGLFATPEAAHEAYKKAADEHYGEFARPQ